MLKAVLFGVFVVLPALAAPTARIKAIGTPRKPVTTDEAVGTFFAQVTIVGIMTYLVWFAG